MARGWESKSVEEQINAREAEGTQTGKPRLTRAQLENQAKREGLLLARVRLLNNLQTARDDRRRKQLEAALAHLDAILARDSATDL